MRGQLAILAASVALFSSADAFAYSYSTCGGNPIKWSGNNVTMRASPNSFPTGYWRNALQRAVDIHYRNPSKFFFTLGTDDTTWSSGNGVNEIFGTTDASVHGGAPAAALTRRTCYWLFGWHYGINESDIYFNYSSPWRWTGDELKTSLWTYNMNGAGLRQLQATAIHELGHSSGLLHESRWYNMMGTDFQHLWANGSTAYGYLGADAGQGTAFLYGWWSSARDFSVAHWAYSGVSGEYSTHRRTRVYSTAGAELPVANVANERGHFVRPGQRVQVEFTYENQGSVTHTAPMRWVISTNDVISTADTTIGTGSITLTPGAHWTARTTVTLPNWLTPGKNYWIGVIADPLNATADNYRQNNATYIPVRAF
ncbi:hypothetical protein [Methylosinus sp. Sm6]|uniref:hypothetical protein n=1 Tax=Methylosinus sp. Sm6 TaxID=2866948 RepID=UPI001C990A13|nr:hypothetical protein [Methylosinus sp. Sm6]MBY6242942.1 hypothetical protein [Methylosinus sp. Sm6]